MNDDDSTLRPVADLATALRARAWLLLLSTLIGLGAGGLFASQAADESYEATAVVRVGNGLVPVVDDVDSSDASSGLQAPEEIYIAQSHDTLLALAERLGYSSTEEVRDRLEVSNPSESDLLLFTFEATGATGAVEGANAAAENYLESRRALLQAERERRGSLVRDVWERARRELSPAVRSEALVVLRQRYDDVTLTATDAGTVVQMAGGSAERTSFPATLLVVLGGAVGLVLGLVTAYLWEAAKPRVRGRTLSVTGPWLGRVKGRRPWPVEAGALMSVPAAGLVRDRERGQRGAKIAALVLPSSAGDAPEHIEKELQAGLAAALAQDSTDKVRVVVVPGGSHGLAQANGADGVVVLVRENATPLADLEQTLELVRVSRMSLLGLIAVPARWPKATTPAGGAK